MAYLAALDKAVRYEWNRVMYNVQRRTGLNSYPWRKL